MTTTLAVSAGIKEIVKTLFEALVLVVIVVVIFLQGFRATLIPLLAVPVSLVGTFMIFPLMGFSINTLSLFGLVLAIGLVVDDAIVVVEAVEHHIEQGMNPRDATIRAMEEVSAPVMAIGGLAAGEWFGPASLIGADYSAGGANGPSWTISASGRRSLGCSIAAAFGGSSSRFPRRPIATIAITSKISGTRSSLRARS
jgi:uncharacterized membrane protein YdfJ with MMPL/SSD domain